MAAGASNVILRHRGGYRAVTGGRRLPSILGASKTIPGTQWLPGGECWGTGLRGDPSLLAEQFPPCHPPSAGAALAPWTPSWSPGRSKPCIHCTTTGHTVRQHSLALVAVGYDPNTPGRKVGQVDWRVHSRLSAMPIFFVLSVKRRIPGTCDNLRKNLQTFCIHNPCTSETVVVSSAL